MDRRVIRARGDWPALRAGFRWPVPDRLNIAEACCDAWAAVAPDKVALIEDEGGRAWTYGALKEASDRLANAFRARGLRRGDRVAVLLPQAPAVPIAHFAAMKCGAVVLPLFTLFGADALRVRLADSGARMAVTDGANLEKLLSLRDDLPDLAEVYATDSARAPVRDLWAEIEAASSACEAVATAAEDPALLLYTSGTTGAPKGVLHAHRFLIGHLPSVELHHGFFPRPGDCGWTPADWAWIGGLMDMAMPCLYYGVPLVCRRMRRFDADEAFALIARHGVRNLFLPPTALKLMRQARVPAGLRVRSVGSGGESLGPEVLEWGRSALGAPINEIYGQTECNLSVCTCAWAMEVRPGWMGQAVPGFDVAVVDGEGRPVPDGETGEIAVRRGTPVMFLEYWKKPRETAAKFLRDPEGGEWLRTGDLGVAEGGYLRFVARDDDVITSAGYRIGPGEIEACLMGHPDVVMAAAVGVPDPLRTEVVRAFVVLRDGAVWEGLEAALIERVRARVGPHLAPRGVVRLDSLPLTATGKVMRRELRAARP